VGIGGGTAFASSKGNHQTYTDLPVGDNQRASSTNYASDIRSVDITSENSGLVHISITLADADAKLVEGDVLHLFIDYDRNQQTGQSGFDLDLVGTGHTSGGTTFLFCRLGQLSSCEEGPSGWAHDQPAGTGMHVVDYYFTTGVPAFDFRVVESYAQPGGSTTLYDYAPNSGNSTFETKAAPPTAVRTCPPGASSTRTTTVVLDRSRSSGRKRISRASLFQDSCGSSRFASPACRQGRRSPSRPRAAATA
jgi:hypothetical protein